MSHLKNQFFFCNEESLLARKNTAALPATPLGNLVCGNYSSSLGTWREKVSF